MGKNKEAKGIVSDVAESIFEVGTSTFLDKLPELGAKVAQIAGNTALSTTVQVLTGGVLGAVAPTLFGITLTFQQKRFERNVIKALDAIIQNQAIIEQNLAGLEANTRQKFINGAYRDVLLDNIISENQEQKVRDNINGYINLMAIENPNDDIVFTFFNTLSQMNELDIRVLRLYRPSWESENNEKESYIDVLTDVGIDETQYNFVREKLYRLGMLESKNEENRDKNLDALGKTLSELIKQMYSKKPKEVKTPKLERIGRTESYHITRLGRQYLNFIEEPK